MRSFIIRPFGTKTKADDPEKSIDFDAVEEKLIAPALQRIGAAGRTTGDAVYAGNIRKDMFELLLQADIVVADITFHNANVFYELGVRHAYRARTTVTIRGSGGDRHVFDLATDRYFTYDSDAPENSVDGLVEVLKRSIANDQDDSPVLSLVPRALRPEPTDLILPHRDFIEEVTRASPDEAHDAASPEVAAMRGHLILLGEECAERSWSVAGQRIVAKALWEAKMYRPARDLGERIRRTLPLDRDINTMLATLYGYLGDPTAANIAIDRILEGKTTLDATDAELLAMRGSGIKSGWRKMWQADDNPAEAALLSPALDEAIETYSTAFNLDLNHYFSGINALTLRVMKRELAEKHPDIWQRVCPKGETERALLAIDAEIAALAPVVRHAIESAIRTAKGDQRIWLALSNAEISLLTDGNTGAERGYLRALHMAQIKPFHKASARRQLEMLKRLGVHEERVAAALTLFGSDSEDAPDADTGPIWLFSGHRVDPPGRANPRFPDTEAAENAARAALKQQLSKAIEAHGTPTVALSGLANGGDILFQEVARELGVETRALLNMDRNAYARSSVVHEGNPAWMERFGTLMAEHPPIYLDAYAQDTVLPAWLIDAPDYSIWQRNNRWLLYTALSYGIDRVRLFALWDGKPGDGSGGTADMVAECRNRGLPVNIVSLPDILGGAPV